MQRFTFYATILFLGIAVALPLQASPAFNSALKKAHSGDTAAQLSVGRMYDQGKGTTANAGIALAWYLEAAASNNADAMFRAGVLYFKGKGAVPQSYASAHRWFMKASQQNHSGAEAYLSDIYAKGLGVKRDAKMAKAWRDLSEAHSGKNNAKIVTNAIDTKKMKTRIKLGKDELLQSILFQIWADNGKAIKHLPSEETTCGRRKFGFVCTSSSRTRQQGNVEFDYEVDSEIRKLSAKDNTFNVVYRNNVTEIRPLSDAPADTPIKLGKQKRSHKLECVLVHKDLISCVKNGISREEYQRVIY